MLGSDVCDTFWLEIPTAGISRGAGHKTFAALLPVRSTPQFHHHVLFMSVLYIVDCFMYIFVVCYFAQFHHHVTVVRSPEPDSDSPGTEPAREGGNNIYRTQQMKTLLRTTLQCDKHTQDAKVKNVFADNVAKQQNHIGLTNRRPDEARASAPAARRPDRSAPKLRPISLLRLSLLRLLDSASPGSSHRA